MRTLAIALTGAMLLFTGHAAAAPQMLGVVAEGTPMQLHCVDGQCMTEISTICLQENRPTPERHHPYRAVDMSTFSVLAMDAAGREHLLPLRDATFRSERGYTAVTVSADLSGLADSGLTPVSLVAGPETAFIPVFDESDENPFSASEIEYVLGSLKPAAARVFSEHGTARDAISIVSKLVNAAPPSGRMTAERRASLWEDVMNGTPREAVGSGVKRAADVYGYCQYRTEQGRFFSVRRCLEQRLDSFLLDLNTVYWSSVKPGS